MRAPALLACAHGTGSPAGRRAIAELRLGVSRLRPGTTALAAHVDVQKPDLAGALRKLAEQQRRTVVVPLLLSAGYHVHHDIARAVDGVTSVAAQALGPDPVLAQVLVDRLVAAGAEPGGRLVLAAAGSSDPRAGRDVEEVTGQLGRLWGGAVVTAYLSAARPTVPEALAAATAEGTADLAVASYLLAPGFFADRLARTVAECAPGVALSAPLAPDDRLAQVVLDRYDAASDF